MLFRSYGTAVLIEYGYIYEQQFLNQKIRPVVFQEMAYQTYLGIKKHFDPSLANFPYDNLGLPYTWKNELREGLKGNSDVFSLQLALVRENLYPPAGLTKNDCPTNGNFGKCVRQAIFAFQKKHNLNLTGGIEKSTLEKLNELY